MLIRFGHFNIKDLTIAKLRNPEQPQAMAAARIIRELRPDVLSINEMESNGNAPDLFADNFLQKGGDGIVYPYRYAGQTNSGIPTGYDHPFDYRGFGLFEGQYGIALFSRFPIDYGGIKNLKDFPWKGFSSFSSSGSYLGNRAVFVPEGFPLFSTAFLSVPVRAGERTIHVVLLHATIPLRGWLNKERNADQIKFMDDYISRRPLPGAEPLPPGPFVAMGDFNSDFFKGEGVKLSILNLLVNRDVRFRDGIGDTFLEGGGREKPVLRKKGLLSLRLDYILPSRDFRVLKAGIYKPEDEDGFLVARTASDHFFIYVDCEME
ncbi:MAG: endonuclease/exonuclease/phosphatase family protein [Nitrospiraceae bacterium]|nr:endonuclease/exonuclease/phosphatase family protein [Nitrospiraceae bacterium]